MALTNVKVEILVDANGQINMRTSGVDMDKLQLVGLLTLCAQSVAADRPHVQPPSPEEVRNLLNGR
jgi:hypothetical protein